MKGSHGCWRFRRKRNVVDAPPARSTLYQAAALLPRSSGFIASSLPSQRRSLIPSLVKERLWSAEEASKICLILREQCVELCRSQCRLVGIEALFVGDRRLFAFGTCLARLISGRASSPPTTRYYETRGSAGRRVWHVSVPRLVMVMRIAISSRSALAYSTCTSKYRFSSNTPVSSSSNSGSCRFRAWRSPRQVG